MTSHTKRRNVGLARTAYRTDGTRDVETKRQVPFRKIKDFSIDSLKGNSDRFSKRKSSRSERAER